MPGGREAEAIAETLQTFRAAAAGLKPWQVAAERRRVPGRGRPHEERRAAEIAALAVETRQQAGVRAAWNDQ